MTRIRRLPRGQPMKPHVTPKPQGRQGMSIDPVLVEFSSLTDRIMLLDAALAKAKTQRDDALGREQQHLVVCRAAASKAAARANWERYPSIPEVRAALDVAVRIYDRAVREWVAAGWR